MSFSMKAVAVEFRTDDAATKTIPGAGFTPTGMLVLGAADMETTEDHQATLFGACDGTNQICFHSTAFGTTGNRWCTWSSAHVVHLRRSDSGSGGRYAFSAWTSDGVDLTRVNAAVVNQWLLVVFFAGDEFDIAVGADKMPTVSGTETLSGLPFQPNLGILTAVTSSMTSTASEPLYTAASGFALGFFTAAGEACAAHGAVDATTSDTGCHADAIALAIPNGFSGAIAHKVTLASFNADGWSLTITNGSGHTTRYGYVALRVPNAYVGQGELQTGTGTWALTASAGFPPALLLGICTPDVTTNDTWTTTSHVSTFGTDGTTQVGGTIHDEHGLVTEDAELWNYTDALIKGYQRDGANSFSLNSSVAFDSWDAGGVTLDQTDAAPSAGKIAYLLIGPAAGAALLAIRDETARVFEVQGGGIALFAWRARDESLTAMTGEAATFDRASSGTLFDANGELVTVGNDLPRWNVVANSVTGLGEPTLLIERGRTNICLQSEDFGTTWAAVGTPTRTPAALTIGDLVLDLIGDDAAGTLEGYSQDIPFTGDALKAVSLVLAAGTSTSTVVRLRDTTAGADRLLATITWAAGVPTVAMTTGEKAGEPVALASGGYRVGFQTTSVTAANTNSLQVYPATDAALAVANTGTVYAGGVQAEDAPFPSSYLKTTTATVTRNGDSLTYPALWPLQDNETWYVRLARPQWADLTTWGQDSYVAGRGTSPPRITVYWTSGLLVVELYDGTTGVNITAAMPGGTGGFIEFAAQWADVGTAGKVRIDTGAGYGGYSATTGGFVNPTPTLVVGDAPNASGNQLSSGLTHVVIASGLQTLATMRGVAEALRVVGLTRLRNDTVEVGEDVLRALGLVRLRGETVSLAETVLRALGIVRLRAETTEVTEDVARVVGLIRARLESVDVTELALALRGLVRLRAETVEIAEQATTVRGLIRLRTETVEVGEDALRSLGLSRARNETIELSEAALRALGLVRGQDETMEITEGTLRTLGLIRTRNETVSIAETVLRALGLTRIRDETADISETRLSLRGLIRLRTESVTLSESILAILGVVRVRNESVSVLDAALRVLGVVRTHGEVVAISESPLRTMGLLRAHDETVQVLETTLRAMELRRTRNETVEYQEVLVRRLGMVRLHGELIDIGEVVLPFRGLVIIRDETVELLEGVVSTAAVLLAGFVLGAITMFPILGGLFGVEPVVGGQPSVTPAVAADDLTVTPVTEGTVTLDPDEGP
jgi:hypothetical protein